MTTCRPLIRWRNPHLIKTTFMQINSNSKFKDKLGRAIADPAFSIHHLKCKLTFKLGNFY